MKTLLSQYLARAPPKRNVLDEKLAAAKTKENMPTRPINFSEAGMYSVWSRVALFADERSLLALGGTATDLRELVNSDDVITARTECYMIEWELKERETSLRSKRLNNNDTAASAARDMNGVVPPSSSSSANISDPENDDGGSDARSKEVREGSRRIKAIEPQVLAGEQQRRSAGTSHGFLDGMVFGGSLSDYRAQLLMEANRRLIEPRYRARVDAVAKVMHRIMKHSPLVSLHHSDQFLRLVAMVSIRSSPHCADAIVAVPWFFGVSREEEEDAENDESAIRSSWFSSSSYPYLRASFLRRVIGNDDSSDPPLMSWGRLHRHCDNPPWWQSYHAMQAIDDSANNATATTTASSSRSSDSGNNVDKQRHQVSRRLQQTLDAEVRTRAAAARVIYPTTRPAVKRVRPFLVQLVVYHAIRAALLGLANADSISKRFPALTPLQNVARAGIFIWDEFPSQRPLGESTQSILGSAKAHVATLSLYIGCHVINSSTYNTMVPLSRAMPRLHIATTILSYTLLGFADSFNTRAAEVASTFIIGLPAALLWAALRKEISLLKLDAVQQILSSTDAGRNIVNRATLIGCWFPIVGLVCNFITPLWQQPNWRCLKAAFTNVACLILEVLFHLRLQLSVRQSYSQGAAGYAVIVALHALWKNVLRALRSM